MAAVIMDIHTAALAMVTHIQVQVMVIHMKRVMVTRTALRVMVTHTKQAMVTLMEVFD